MQKQKIGIYAGTFDPIHEGHVDFAVSAITAGKLERVIIVAEKEPYRKRPHAAWDHRQAMIERATEDIEAVDHDYHFASQLAHQHTMKDMLESAERHYSPDHEYWFLVGSDVFEHLHQWHNLVHQQQYGGFIVALRDDHTESWVRQKQQAIELPAAKVVVVPSRHPRMNSSAVRESAKNGTTPSYMNARVGQYIKEHQLYDAKI